MAQAINLPNPWNDYSLLGSKIFVGCLKFGSIDLRGQPKYILLVVMKNSD
jgi:hypothetical protein